MKIIAKICDRKFIFKVRHLDKNKKLLYLFKRFIVHGKNHYKSNE